MTAATVDRRRRTLVALDLPGPSRRIRVEPIRVPDAPLPEPRRPPVRRPRPRRPAPEREPGRAG